MLVVKVEVWPGGDATRAESLGVLAIINRGIPYETAEPDLRIYEIELQQGDKKPIRARLDHYRRAGWLKLVSRAFLEAASRG